MPRRALVALGGNAILPAGRRGTAQEQEDSVAVTCRHIAAMIQQGYEVVITHGNGPQVGNILLQNEEARRVVPPMPLHICGAQSQGLIGFMIQRILHNELRRRGLHRPVVTVVTQVVVDRDDPAFADPTKPIGPYYSRTEVERLQRERQYCMREFGDRGWRRVVPSPDPRGIVEKEAIAELLRQHVIVVASGGGGIPVRVNEAGELEGVEAVIDKDLAGARLAGDVRANLFLLLTDVEKVALNYGRPDQRFLDRMTAAEARRYLKDGQFPPGTMGPKVEAAVRFVEAGGDRAVITSLEMGRAALRAAAGTVITQSPAPGGRGLNRSAANRTGAG